MTDPRTALVAGASSAMGLAFARAIARDGLDLVMVARSGAAMEEEAQELEERYDVAVTVLPKDLALAGAAAAIGSNLAQRGVSVDVLIDLTTTSEPTLTFLPGMVERRRGSVLVAVPSAERSAAGAALRSSLSLARELRGSGVTLTALCPDTRSDSDAEDVAVRGYEAMKRGRLLVVSGAGLRLLALRSRVSLGRRGSSARRSVASPG